MIHKLTTPTDFSFVETLNAHGWRRLPPFHSADETATLVRVERLSSGEVVKLTITGTESAVSITSEADFPKVEIERLVRVMFQLDLPIHEFHSYCRSVGNLAHVPGLRQGRMLCSPTLWEDCCKVILTTNTTWSQTIGMTSRLVANWGSPLPENEGLRAFPTPEQIACVPFEDFGNLARFGYRNLAIHELAQRIAAGELNLEALRDSTLPAAELWKSLLALRGVGPYAASCLMIYMGRYERVNVDSWARMMVSKELDRQVTDREVHEFFEPHGEWRGLVYHFYPWRVQEPAY